LPKDEAIVKGSNLGLIVTSHGGHLGFLEGNGKKEKHYMEKLVGEIVLAIRDHGKEELSAF
jgi:predicted alpha/beta-fold hydrolase